MENVAQSTSRKTVTIEYKPDEPPVYITEWSSNGIPIVGNNKIEISVDSQGDGKFQLDCCDKLTDCKYSGEQLIPKYEKYMVLVVEDDKAILKPCTYFRMKPKLNLPTRTSDKISSLTYSEQMDEINEKFGSKKSIRRIDEKKKNAIAYGTDEYKDMKEKVKELTPHSINGADGTDKKGENTNYEDPFLMPPRNLTATNVEKVYNLNDIMPISLIESMKIFYDFNDIKPNIESPLVQHFAMKVKDDSGKASCLFLDTLIKYKRLKPSEIGKVEICGIDGVKCNNLVAAIVQNYSISTIYRGKPRRTLDEKCKDKIIIHSIILCVLLNQYRPLLVSALAQAFQTSVIKIKKFGNIVGCHVEMNTAKTERFLVLRIPLYSMENENKYKRRKTR